MLRPSWLLIAGLVVHPSLYAQVFQRDIGDFDLKLGTTPSRSMAAGLVQPSTGSSFHGGLDLTHESGLYFGQWSPSMGLTSSSNLEVDSYVGFKHPFDNALGYEVGVIQYSYPEVDAPSTHAFYAGLRVMDRRFGAAFNNTPDSQNSTLFADLGGLPLLDVGFTMKVSNHQLTTPFTIGEGQEVRAFNDWSLQMSRPIGSFDLNFIYSGSDLSGANCAAYSGQNGQCDSLFMLKAQHAFF
jgi:uncharacterized protein (TIGR02001 family)